MAETLVFSIPAPAAGETPAVEVNWFQSTDGETWGASPVDTVLVADLPQDPETLKYTWASALADPTKWHLLKTESGSGVMGIHGTVVPPRGYMPIVRREVNNYGQPLVDSEGTPLVGVRIEFRLMKNNLPMDGEDTTTKERIVSQPIVTTTDVNGEFTVSLWPTDRGATGLQYRCIIRCGSQRAYYFALAAGDFSAVKLSTLI